jgi:hypothetical protein
VVDLSVELEGYDFPTTVLRKYNRESATWDLPKQGDFWNSVALAHGLGSVGRGRQIAVVDAGFDFSVPALSGCKRWGPEDVPSAHGTVVALLIREVAPEAELILYTANRNGRMDAGLVAEAIKSAATNENAHIINLSLGIPLLRSSLQRLSVPVIPIQMVGGLDFHWRNLYEIPKSAIGDAAAEAATAGTIVVAAAGNGRDKLYSPAALPKVFSIGFFLLERLLLGGVNAVLPHEPAGFSQALECDFQFVQPSGTLGSSFAAPLFSGFASLMQDPSDLHSYRELGLYCSNGQGLAMGFEGRRKWDEYAEHVEDLYRAALANDPHQHLSRNDLRPCAECSWLAAPIYISMGLWRLLWGRHEAAETLLRAARAIAPQNPDAAASLAMAIAARVDGEKEKGQVAGLSTALFEAADHMELAISAYPDNRLFELRRNEFIRAAIDPSKWHLKRDPPQGKWWRIWNES